MSKFVAILYSTLILFQSFNISFEDFSKFGKLLEHAEYHQQTYGDSFFDFISEHYGQDFVKHETEHSGHDELPFKHHHQVCVHAHPAFTLQAFDFNLEYQPFIEIPFNFHYNESISLFEKSSLFQPPKFA